MKKQGSVLQVPVRAVSGISREVNVSVRSQQSDTSDSPVSSDITRNSDEKSNIGQTSSVEAASNTELHIPATSNEERTTGPENEDLLDEVPSEETLINETVNADNLERSDVTEAATISSDSCTAGKDTVTVNEVTASSVLLQKKMLQRCQNY